MKPAQALTHALVPLAATLAGIASAATMAAPHPDPRLREIAYDAAAVVSLPVKRGTVTLLVLGADEAITEVASGIGADCAKPDSAWCVAAQPGGRTVFIKPKTAAGADNNLAVITNRRIHNLRLVVLPDGDPRPAVYRLVVRPPEPERAAAATPSLRLPVLKLPELPLPPRPEYLVAERLQAKPQVMNTHYAMAEGRASEDIVPSLVFDDGRFTYLKFPGNREVPAVFHVLGDGSETLVNARMEDDLLVVDRVSRRLVLRAGNAVVGLWNEAFDLDGIPPDHGTTIPGVERVLKAAQAGRVEAPTGVTP